MSFNKKELNGFPDLTTNRAEPGGRIEAGNFLPAFDLDRIVSTSDSLVFHQVRSTHTDEHPSRLLKIPEGTTYRTLTSFFCRPNPAGSGNYNSFAPDGSPALLDIYVYAENDMQFFVEIYKVDGGSFTLISSSGFTAGATYSGQVYKLRNELPSASLDFDEDILWADVSVRSPSGDRLLSGLSAVWVGPNSIEPN